MNPKPNKKLSLGTESYGTIAWNGFFTQSQVFMSSIVVSCHRQISCLKVVLPLAKYIWGPKLRWAALIRRKDGSTVDSFEENLEVYIILDPNNLDSSISSMKNIYQQFLFPNQRMYFYLAILNLQQWRLICTFRKTVTFACGRWLGRKDLCTFTALASDVVVFSWM